MEQREDIAVALISVIVLVVVLITFLSGVLQLNLATIPSRLPLQEFLWTYRGLDVLVQAFIVFAAASAVGALFRAEKGPGAVETTYLEPDGEEEKEET